MKNFFLLLSALFMVFFLCNPASALTVTAFDSADNLAQTLVGTGVTISNVNYTGATVASGYFTGASALGEGFFDQGIVLTTGYASHLNGSVNTSDGITGSNGLAGDPDLNSLIPGYSTYDATVLSFDFVSNGDAAYFNYFFGSEEYNEYVGTMFNDVFGFFFEGQNIALIPGTTTPVAINNVNNSVNSQYYNDNDPTDLGVPTPFPFEYDGFTDVFTAQILGLTPGQTYSLKLAIADAGDFILDSGVFLQAGSFSDTPVNPVPEPATALMLVTGLIGLAAVNRRRFRK